MSFLLDRICRLWSKDLAMDLGTNNIRVYETGKEIILREAAVVAVKQSSRGLPRVLAVGGEAKRMLGRAPAGVSVLRPLQDGVIADFTTLEIILRHFISGAHGKKPMGRPRLIVSVPLGVTPVEKRAVRDCALRVGAREVYIMEEPLAAAIGAGLPVSEAISSMIVDIGGGTTEAAVISLGGIVNFKSVRIGGNRMDDAIAQFIRNRYNMLIGEDTAERIKMEIGSAHPMDETRHLDIKGLDLVTGLPTVLALTSDDIRPALSDLVSSIVDTVLEVLETCPPELSADLLERGIVLTGGGALLQGVGRRIQEATSLPIILAEDPMTTVVRGLGRVLEDASLDSFRNMG